MKRVGKIILATALTGAMMLSMIGCGSSKDSSASSTSAVSASSSSAAASSSVEAFDPTKVTGTVNFAVPSWDVEDEKKVIEKFNEVYPNVTVNVTGFEGNLNEYLTTQAASNTLPDVTYGWENLNFPISQGWLYPIDEFLAKDSEAANVDQNIMNSYKFGGKTYAVPINLEFNCVMVNLDLLEQLNLDVPTYEWTVDQFKDLLTKATTDKYSGINHLWDFESVMSGMYSKDLAQSAYDPASGKLKLTDGSWVKAITLQKELKAIPGLVSDDLKNSKLTDEGKEDDYQKKFGKDADALREGKILMGFHGTWDLGWIRTMSYKYDMYPLPQVPEVGYRQTLHANHAFMMATTKSPEASFEFLKWISYGKQGILARLDLKKSKVDDKGQPAPDFFIPSSKDADVVKAFEDLDYVPAGVKYLYNHMDKAFRADFYKIVPDWQKVMDEVIVPKSEEIRQGKVDASAVAAELESKANSMLDAARATFDKQLADVQAKFTPAK